MIALYKHVHYHVTANSNALPLDNRGTPGADPGFQKRRFIYRYKGVGIADSYLIFFLKNLMKMKKKWSY